jgi:hypothetical protein
MKKSILIALLFSLVFLMSGIAELGMGDSPTSNTSNTVEVTLIGPKQYIRTNGKPNIYTNTFPGRVGQGKLIVKNGEGSGANRISSAIVKINDTQVLGTQDFNQNVYEIGVATSLMEHNTITVELRSKPGSYLTIEVKQEIIADGAKVIGPTGGSVTTDNGTAILEVPADAVTNDILFTITLSKNIQYNPVLDAVGYFPITENIDLQPNGIVFTNPVYLRIKYDDSVIPTKEAEDNLHVVNIGNTAETCIDLEPIQIDADNNNIILPLFHFTSLVVVMPRIDCGGTYNFKWNTSEIKYFIAPDGYGYLWGLDYSLRKIVKDAVESWMPYQGQFKMTEVDDSLEANIILSPVDYIPGALAITEIIPYEFIPTISKLLLDQSEKILIKFESSIRSRNYYNYDFNNALASVVRHEVGHSLGLAHNSSSHSYSTPYGVPAMWVSWPFGDVFKEFERKITGDDIRALQCHYGPPGSFVFFSNFDDGTLQGWGTIDYSCLSSERAYSGNYSIKVNDVLAGGNEAEVYRIFQPAVSKGRAELMMYIPSGNSAGISIFLSDKTYWQKYPSTRFQIYFETNGQVYWNQGGWHQYSNRPIVFDTWNKVILSWDCATNEMTLNINGYDYGTAYNNNLGGSITQLTFQGMCWICTGIYAWFDDIKVVKY